MILLAVPLYRLRGGRLRRFEHRAVRVGLAIVTCRLMVPTFLAAMTLVHTMLIAEQYRISSAAVEAAGREIGDVYGSPTAGLAEGGLVERLKGALGTVTDPGASMSQKFADLRVLVERWIDHLVDLGTLFLVETILFPLLWLWVVRAGIPWVIKAPERI
jgi:hypothetical protein